jgi:phage tail protein X
VDPNLADRGCFLRTRLNVNLPGVEREPDTIRTCDLNLRRVALTAQI